MVVESSFQSPTPPTRLSSQWHNHSNNHNTSSSIQTTHDLAWSVLRQVHDSQSPYFIFHSFSNGGCFLWEEIRTILNSSMDQHNGPSSQPQEKKNEHNDEEFAEIRALHDKLVGVVFDSSPGALEDTETGKSILHQALSYCTWQERWPLLVELYAKQWFQPNFQQQSRARAVDFLHGMRDDPRILPQLYLYSEDDAVTMFGPLQELVQHRQAMFGTDMISYQHWKSSHHCCHLLEHKEDYEQAIEQFVMEQSRRRHGHHQRDLAEENANG
jgi:hypothetical protein